MFLYQEESGFLFNSDSHFLYNFITKFSPKGELLDIGSGCGIVGLLCGDNFPISLTQIDIQKHNIFLNRKNAEVNSIKTEVIEGDFLTYEFKKKFDFIVSNPPYYHDGIYRSKNSIIHISRYNTHLPINLLIQKVYKDLKNRGQFIFCYDANMIFDLLFQLKSYKFQIEDMQFVHGTEDKNASLILIHARKNSKAKTKVHPPLINMKDQKPTKEVKSIYQKTRTYSIKCKVL